MDYNLVDTMENHIQKGRRISFRQSATGQVKLFVALGPFGILTRRYMANNATFQEIKKVFAASNMARV